MEKDEKKREQLLVVTERAEPALPKEHSLGKVNTRQKIATQRRTNYTILERLTGWIKCRDSIRTGAQKLVMPMTEGPSDGLICYKEYPARTAIVRKSMTCSESQQRTNWHHENQVQCVVWLLKWRRRTRQHGMSFVNEGHDYPECQYLVFS